MHIAPLRARRLRPGVITVVALFAAFSAASVIGPGPEHDAGIFGATASASAATVFGDATPGAVADADTRPVELGLRFRVNRSGVVSGVRFYKSAANTGSHDGRLWDAHGRLLAEATFVSETSAGWQTVLFDTPVPVWAATTYVVSYHTDTGRYPADPFGLDRPIDAGPLTALGSVYAYGKTSAFPTSTWMDANYWVDVIFGDRSPVTTTTVPPAPPTSWTTTTTTTTRPTTTATRATSTTMPRSTTTVPSPPTTGPQPVTPGNGSAAGFPSSATTGVPAGRALGPSGPITVTTEGTVIDGLDVSGCIDVLASNVVIRNTRVRFTGGCGHEVVRLRPGTGAKNLLVHDSELDGQDRPDCGESIGYSDYTLIRVDMHSCSDGPRVSESATVVIRDSYIHDLSNLPGDHGDGIQCYGGRGPMTIVHNTIHGGTNAAFMTADHCSGPLLLDSNLFIGGGYSLRLYDNIATVTNNVFVKGSTSFGPVAIYRGPQPDNPDVGTTIVAWSNNRMAVNADGSGLAETVDPS